MIMDIVVGVCQWNDVAVSPLHFTDPVQILPLLNNGSHIPVAKFSLHVGLCMETELGR